MSISDSMGASAETQLAAAKHLTVKALLALCYNL